MDFDYTIVRSNRKSIAITLKGCDVIVRAPKRASMVDIQRFLQRQEGWVKQHLERAKAREEFVCQMQLDRYFYIFESRYLKTSFLEKISGSSIFSAKDIAFMAKQVDMLFKVSSSQEKEACEKKIYLKLAQKILVPLAQSLICKVLEIRSTTKTGKIKPTDFEIKLCSSHRLWGSLNEKRVMKLNYKLIMLPQNLAEYVIIHEICHAFEMNHSPAFWAQVEQFCPQFCSFRKILANFSPLLR